MWFLIFLLGSDEKNDVKKLSAVFSNFKYVIYLNTKKKNTQINKWYTNLWLKKYFTLNFGKSSLKSKVTNGTNWIIIFVLDSSFIKHGCHTLSG